VKTRLPSTRVAYYEMYPIKGPHDWKHRTVEELEEEAYFKSSVCK